MNKAEKRRGSKVPSRSSSTSVEKLLDTVENLLDNVEKLLDNVEKLLDNVEKLLDAVDDIMLLLIDEVKTPPSDHVN